MKEFIKKYAPSYEFCEELARMSIQSRRLTKYASKQEKQHAQETGKILKRNKVGRPQKFIRFCSFCHKEHGTDGDMIQHWKDTHFKTKKNVWLPRVQGSIGCPMLSCQEVRISCRIKLRKHLVDPKIHSLENLLEKGVEVWFYREHTTSMIKICIKWLEENGFIKKILSKKHNKKD